MTSPTDDWRQAPRRGDLIRARWPRSTTSRVPRRIVAVDDERVLTSGQSGCQRNRWMRQTSLRNYELVERP